MASYNLLEDFHCLQDKMLSYLALHDLVQFGSCCNRAHITATKIANVMIISELKGVHLSKKTADAPRHTMPSWAQLRAATRPFCFVNGHIKDWRTKTKPTPFVVDSKGPIFLEFQVIAAKAANGTPTVGLVNAECPGEADAEWPSDLSRSGV
eukprot:gnl/TRDRNA2_/TRDRNA2_137825_c0_seq1.p1 gnl/TRDRNA2_/TRDRNA2_137825_c0~~gnl/TRDRNA2_/TRDRNA2_137825_c0_seq1.p1  ORF type:complete len:152 (-),score=16.19 gnl/TRDRNA2_/TRDRNA2_137825_c0_seq1:8-463(-)